MTRGDDKRDRPATDFAPTEGGPFHRLLQRARLDGEGAGKLRRRILILVGLTWLPLALLSMLEGHFRQPSLALPFVADVTAHVRFLVVIPLLLAAEVFLQSRLGPLPRGFTDREMVAAPDLPRFRSAFALARRLSESWLAELAILLVVYTVGVLMVQGRQEALHYGTWVLPATTAERSRSLAGLWYDFVSLPLLQFLLLRWYYRLLVWIILLWRLSRLPLRLYPAHPDRVGGLGFLSGSVTGFLPFVLAHGALFAGTLADHVLFLGASLLDFRAVLATLGALLFCAIQVPLLLFTPQLVAARLRGRGELGRLGVRYVSAFEAKWLRGPPPEEKLLGSTDLQSLSDLGGSIDLVRAMRITLFSYERVLQFVVMLVLPLVPLALLQMPLADLLKKLSQLVL